MSMFIALLLIALAGSLPIMLFTRRIMGKHEDTMGMGIGDIKFGQNLGAKHWQKMNGQSENQRNR